MHSPDRLRPDIVALPVYRQGAQPPAGGFKLSSNEYPYPLPDRVTAAIRNAASEANRYPSATALELRQKLADRHGLSVDEVHVSAGSVSILAQLVLAVASPGTEIVYPWRSFEAYPGLVTVSGAKSVQVPNIDREFPGSGERFDHDLAAMSAAVGANTGLVIVCSPNNPTGTAVRAVDFEKFMSTIPPQVLVALDEAYAEFVTARDAVHGMSLLARFPNMVVLRTFSKAYGLAGLRIGYALGSARILDALRSTAIPLAVTAAALDAAAVALEPEVEAEFREKIADITGRRDRLADELRGSGWRVPNAQGNFLWLPTGETTDEVAARLLDAGIIARPFPPDGIRLTVGDEASVEPILGVLKALPPKR